MNLGRTDLLWLRAAVLGSIWASSEIILGSFLHNLRIPFSGTFLSAIGVYLITAFDVKWKQPGVIWRAGLICALMKSISPSAIIFGPMIAIVMESFLFSSSIKLLGRNIIGYGIGGALAVTWSLIHRISNMLIIYGPDVIKIYSNIYKYAAKTISVNLGSPATLVIILFAVYFIFGFVSSMLGRSAGKKGHTVYLDTSLSEENTFLTRNNKSPFAHHSIIWLFLEVAIIAAGLFVISFYSIFAGGCFVLSATLINLLHYKKFLSKRFKLKFWIQLIIITTIAGLFIQGIKSTGWEFSVSNLANGFEISLRALLLTQCFGLIGIELANPSIKKFFLKFNFGKLPAALEIAFEALPLMLSVLSSNKDKFRTPSVLIAGYLTIADNWISEVSNRFRLKKQ